MSDFDDCKPIQWRPAVLQTGQEATLHASNHYSSVCSCKELLLCLPPPLPSICFLLGAFEEAAGLPCKMPVLPPCPVFPFPSLCTAQRHAGLSCVASQMLVYLGRQAEAAVGATGGKGTLRQAEVGRPTVRLGAAETNQTGVLTL